MSILLFLSNYIIKHSLCIIDHTTFYPNFPCQWNLPTFGNIFLINVISFKWEMFFLLVRVFPNKSHKFWLFYYFWYICYASKNQNWMHWESTIRANGVLLLQVKVNVKGSLFQSYICLTSYTYMYCKIVPSTPYNSIVHDWMLNVNANSRLFLFYTNAYC